MLRALLFLIVIAAIVFAEIWLLENSGYMEFELMGANYGAEFAVWANIVFAAIILSAYSYRIWLFLRRAPKRMTGAWRNRRRAQGYRALTQGMVAVAAGDPGEAKRQSKRAEVLLNEPPLTMLLSAQAAQLNGDEQAAEEFFRAMTENPETEFLGLRGLITQARKRGDGEAALKLTRRAYGLRPKSEWVAQNLFDLQIRERQWLEAGATGDDLVRIGVSARKDNQHRKAALLTQQGLEAGGWGDHEEAARLFKQAVDQDPRFIPAVAAFARSLNRQGRQRKAVQLIEKTWKSTPHPDLLEPYWQAGNAEDAMARIKASQKLAKTNAPHEESHIAVVTAALGARLWGEARGHLEQITGDNADAMDTRICRLWAELEEAEHDDMEQVHAWLTRASLADPAPTWTCSSCGNVAEVWTATCGNCQGFDTFTWRRPPHVGPLPEPSANLPVVGDSDAAAEAV